MTEWTAAWSTRQRYREVKNAISKLKDNKEYGCKLGGFLLMISPLLWSLSIEFE